MIIIIIILGLEWRRALMRIKRKLSAKCRRYVPTWWLKKLNYRWWCNNFPRYLHCHSCNKPQARKFRTSVTREIKAGSRQGHLLLRSSIASAWGSGIYKRRRALLIAPEHLLLQPTTLGCFLHITRRLQRIRQLDDVRCFAFSLRHSET